MYHACVQACAHGQEGMGILLALDRVLAGQTPGLHSPCWKESGVWPGSAVLGQRGGGSGAQWRDRGMVLRTPGSCPCPPGLVHMSKPGWEFRGLCYPGVAFPVCP